MIIPRRFLLNDVNDICKILKKQRTDDDIFITKYSNDGKINNIILDFDGEEDKEKVYKEVLKMHNFLATKGLNSVIVTSTNKGFHFYVQIPTVCFDGDTLSLDNRDSNRLFVMFTKNLINPQHFELDFLDPTNTNAGLRGNIRLLGSIHPKTNEKVHIVKGELLDLNDEGIRDEYYGRCSHYVNSIYKSSIHQYWIKEKFRLKELEKKKKKIVHNENWKDPIAENDLRTLLPSLYGGDVKRYDGYIFMQCPWHTDRRPSLMVTKEWFYCTGCGTKGNVWTLIKNKQFKL